MPNLTPDDAGWYLDEFDAERFWTSVNFHGGDDYKADPLATAAGECWLWTAGKNEGGYGRFRVFGDQRSAHRIAFKDFGGNLPDEMVLDHLCRVHDCVRPSHVEPVTHAVNMSRGTTAQKTHCIHGHEFTPENTRLVVKGETTSRFCRACRRGYYHRRKNAA